MINAIRTWLFNRRFERLCRDNRLLQIDDPPIVRFNSKTGHFVDVVTGQRPGGWD